MRPTTIHLAQLQELQTAIDQDQPVTALQRSAAMLNDIANSPRNRVRPAPGARIAIAGGSTEDEIEKVVEGLESFCSENQPESRPMAKGPKGKAAKADEEAKAKAAKAEAGKTDEEGKARATKEEQASARATAANPLSVGAAQQRINDQAVTGDMAEFSWEDVVPLIQVIVNLVRRWRGQ